MIDVQFHRGLRLPEADLWLDPRDSKPWAFISHAHADHVARHEKTLCTDLTAAFLRSRFDVPEERLEPVPYHVPVERHGHRLRLLPAGHIAGSAMLHVTRLSDGATLLYTGDFKTRRGRTADPVTFQQADLLILESTFGLPHYVFPPSLEVEMQILRFVHDAFADGEVPVLLGYPLGKAQEALAILHAHDIPALLHPGVAGMTLACRAAGVPNLPEPLFLQAIFEDPQSAIPAGHAIIAPPKAVRSKYLRAIPNLRVAMLSGWALDPSAAWRYRGIDEVIPLSDHADHPGLLECIQRVRPKKILTVHGYEREFAADLRRRGYDAWSATGHDQLELGLAAQVAPVPAAQRTVARHTRPICPLADFSDLCRLAGETNSRLEKIRHLSTYLRGLESDDYLSLAATWLTGHALPRENGHRPLHLGTAALRRTLLRLPGAREERYREISLSLTDPTRHLRDPARTARLFLQELPLKPEPLDLPGAAAFFRELAALDGSIARLDLLAGRLRTLHPAEGEILVKLLSGDLGIGLREELAEDALAAAFDADPTQIRRSHLLTGDLGRTALLARDRRLAEDALRPLVPVKAIPYSALRVRSGPGAQLHKQGDRAALFSSDLRPLDSEFPELPAAALELPGDFILDGEIAAPTAEDLFSGRAAAVRFIACDLLFRDGADLLAVPAGERRRRLEDLLSRSATGAISIVG